MITAGPLLALNTIDHFVVPVVDLENNIYIIFLSNDDVEYHQSIHHAQSFNTIIYKIIRNKERRQMCIII